MSISGCNSLSLLHKYFYHSVKILRPYCRQVITKHVGEVQTFCGVLFLCCNEISKIENWNWNCPVITYVMSQNKLGKSEAVLRSAVGFSLFAFNLSVLHSAFSHFQRLYFLTSLYVFFQNILQSEHFLVAHSLLA